MQNITRYLQQNQITVYITGFAGRNSKVYDRQIKISRGVSNTVSFVFKNEDQKRVDISTKTLEFTLFNSNGRILLQKSLTVLDDGSTDSTKGTAEVTFTTTDLYTVKSGYYNYSVIDRVNGVDFVTFVDTSYDAGGAVHVVDNVMPAFVPSTAVSTFLTNSLDINETKHISSAVYTDLHTGSVASLQTAVIYSTNYSGTVEVQGTNDSTVTIDTEFSTLATATVSASDTINYVNFTSHAKFVRFVWYTDPTISNGTVDKVLFRS